MNESADGYVIAVGHDLGTMGDLALERALELSELRGGAALHVISVGPAVAEDAPTALAEAMASRAAPDALRALETVLRPRVRGRAARVVPHVAMGAPADAIIRAAAEVEADLVVVGTHGRRGLGRVLLGSVAARVAELAHCPVLVVRPKDHSGVESAIGPADRELGIRGAIL